MQTVIKLPTIIGIITEVPAASAMGAIALILASTHNLSFRACSCCSLQSFLPRNQNFSRQNCAWYCEPAGRAHTFNFALLHTAKHGVEGGARKDNRASRGEGQRGARRKLDSTANGTTRAACLHRVSGRRAAMIELWRQAVKGDEL